MAVAVQPGSRLFARYARFGRNTSQNVWHWLVSRPSAARAGTQTNSRNSLLLHARLAHDALPLHRVRLDQLGELGGAERRLLEEGRVEPRPRVGVGGERAGMAVEMVDDLPRRAARREQREPGAGVETGKALLGEGRHVRHIADALAAGDLQHSQVGGLSERPYLA